MSFALSSFGILLGLGAIAGAVFLLQRLRVRHREVPVVTTLFWKQAVEETRARVFVRRFRHWPAYLLFLAIGALLWLGFAQPRAGGSGAGRLAQLLDGSAGMAWKDRFAQAKQALLDDVASFPPERTQVLFCGGTVRTLLAPGENPLVLTKRLEGLAPEAAPSTLQRTLRSVLAEAHARTSVVVYGDGPLEANAKQASVERRTFAPDRAGNRGFAAVGIAEAASGRWDAVDVYLEVRGGGDPTSLVAVTIDGEAPPEPGGMEGEGARVVWRDVPARGGLLEARLPGDGLALDVTAAVRLPSRTPIRVQLSPKLDAVLRPVLEQDPGIALVDADPDVEIGTSFGIPPPGHHAVLSFHSMPEVHPHTIQVMQPTLDAQAELQVLQRVLALAEIDGAALAEALGRPVTVGVEDGVSRLILVDAALLGADAGFVGSRAFPLFLAGAIRHLAGRDTFRPYAAVGEAVPGTDRPFRHAAAAMDPVGVDLVPAVAGDHVAAGDAFTASLLTNELTADASAGVPENASAAGSVDLALLAILLAFALLLVEWTLFRSGRVP